MRVRDAIVVMIVTTLCISYLAWGTIYVVRTVINVNYRPLTAEETYVKCVYGASGVTNLKADINNKSCAALAGVNPNAH